jgi:hypothetical protein
VTVEIDDVDPRLTTPADVESGVQFVVTAHLGGALDLQDDGATIIGPDGTRNPVRLPASAHIDEWLVPDGGDVTTALPIARATYTGFALVSPVVGADLLKFTTPPSLVDAQVDGGGAPFKCDLLDAFPSRLNGEDSFIACIIPNDQPVVTGMNGLVSSSFAGATAVPTLPVEAVAGSMTSGSVYKRMPDGSAAETRVELGLNDGVRVQVLSGVSPGDEVYLPAPSIVHG